MKQLAVRLVEPSKSCCWLCATRARVVSGAPVGLISSAFRHAIATRSSRPVQVLATCWWPSSSTSNSLHCASISYDSACSSIGQLVICSAQGDRSFLATTCMHIIQPQILFLAVAVVVVVASHAGINPWHRSAPDTIYIHNIYMHACSPAS